ncbi:MAG: glycosyltransferase, partial [Bacteroidia bacterium]|nr:glycosyltransferase [Bacteroidia bacterium]
VHAHYASSYGYLGAYSKFHPFVISAWGTDVMKFPYEGKIKNKLIKFSLNKADALCATSNTLDVYIKKLVSKPVHVIPFGIDLNLFKEIKELKSPNKFVFGAVKSFEKIYNIDILIKAFALVHTKHPKTELLLVGDGSEKDYLMSLVKQLKLESSVIFAGRVPSAITPQYFNKLNCLVNVSQYESFGVSVIEAMACKVPVIVSATGGLMEIVTHEVNGLHVSHVNESTTADAMERMLSDKSLADKLIANAYLHVKENYDWQNNLKSQINVYNQLLNSKI